MSDNKASKLDMDLINMVQNARMMHDKDAVPSKVPGVYWIESKNPAPKNKPTACTGEFQIQTTVDAVDEHWQMIKKATEKGLLGYKSKVSTVATDGTPHGKQRLICIRSYDANDSDDCERIKAQLHNLGFTEITYKQDA